jgi:quercetin dioxygenase-like cupin family protein
MSFTEMGQPDLVTSVETAQGYWQMGILWTPLVTTEQTRGEYSLMEQLMPVSAGPPPHMHDHGDEVFYILDGEMAMQLGDETITGTTGQLVRIPAGTAHAFVVTSETARVLNFYVPAGLDMQVAMLGTPASAPTLPPEGVERSPTDEQQRAFSNRLHDLATQRMAPVADLLAHYRASHGKDQMP